MTQYTELPENYCFLASIEEDLGASSELLGSDVDEYGLLGYGDAFASVTVERKEILVGTKVLLVCIASTQHGGAVFS